MGIEFLKWMRTVVPGTAVLLGLVPLYTFWTGKAVGSFDWVFAGSGLVVAYVLGAAYNSYCLRAVFNGRSHARITTNIKTRLLGLRTTPITQARRDQLLQGTELMDVFYSLVDSDDTLKERAKLVRHNGLWWSSIADVTVLGVGFAALHLTLWLILDYKPFLGWGAAFAAAALIAGVFLHPRAERRHIELGNAQLDFIGNQMAAAVQQKVNAL